MPYLTRREGKTLLPITTRNLVVAVMIVHKTLMMWIRGFFSSYYFQLLTLLEHQEQPQSFTLLPLVLRLTIEHTRNLYECSPLVLRRGLHQTRNLRGWRPARENTQGNLFIFSLDSINSNSKESTGSFVYPGRLPPNYTQELATRRHERTSLASVCVQCTTNTGPSNLPAPPLTSDQHSRLLSCARSPILSQPHRPSFFPKEVRAAMTLHGS